MLSGLEKKSFPESIDGSRISLVRPQAMNTLLVWEYIQRDHGLGGSNYAWIESEQDVAKYITIENPGDSKEISYLIFKGESVIGSFHIHTIIYADYKAEIGYAIEKGEEGNGYASEALELIESEMKRLGFNKLVISCDSNNRRSIKVAERNGFLHEGTLLQDCVENGKFRDSVVFGKLLNSPS